jgi:glutathione synthase/RimK-type ligase-like ATP-grasp enzyme
MVRLGSSTTVEEYNRERARLGLRPVTNLVECNTVEAVKTSANKLAMKTAFFRNNVKTAIWFTCLNGVTFVDGQSAARVDIGNLPYPIVAKHHFGSRGTGNTLINSRAELETFMTGKTLSSYIFEKFYNYSREYRLHVDSEGCFYTCRKLLKEDTPEENRWFRNDSNSVWILEDNPSFDKPANWDAIVAECVKALKAVKLDVGAIDLRIQSPKSRHVDAQNPDFIILETNSAPSFGEKTLEKYLVQLPIILKRKHANR